MTLAPERGVSGDFEFEDITPGIHASGFGQIGDGRTFSFSVRRHVLTVEVYRPRMSGPVPQAEDVIATASRGLVDIDVTDERSLAAAVRDAVATAQPVSR